MVMLEIHPRWLRAKYFTFIHTQTVYANDIQVNLMGEVCHTELYNKCHKNQVQHLQVNFVKFLFVAEKLTDTV